MVIGILRRQRQVEPVNASVPPGLRIYTVGDVHGRLDLLDRLLDRITADGAEAPHLTKYLIFLGDYVDRGPDSKGVIERLIAGPPPSFGAVHLKGNHEATMVQFFDDLTIGPNWLAFGGTATLESYGVALSTSGHPATRIAKAQEGLCANLPATHRAFLTHLRSTVSIGDYLFVHAGIRPGVPLDRQREQDMMWIRDEFLESAVEHGKVVVHGHTISPEPEMRANRIGIDTGAFATGRLTCLVLESNQRRFLST